jgi:RNA polymerase sigma factor (sigma-70 family)
MPPQDPEQAKWFAMHLQPHETMLRAWLRQRFPSESDVDDLIQDAFIRVLAARGRKPIASPKAFLFATARNLAVDRLRHQQVVGENWITENDLSSVLDENADVPLAVERAQQLELLTLAIQSLPTRCRQVLTLRKIYGLSQREVAAQLGISVNTVEVHSAAGLRKITAFIARRRGAK